MDVVVHDSVTLDGDTFLTTGAGTDDVRIATAGDDHSGGAISVPTTFLSPDNLALVAAGDLDVADSVTLQAPVLTVEAYGTLTVLGLVESEKRNVLTVLGNEIELLNAAGSLAGTGSLRIGPASPGQDVTLASGGSTAALDLSSDEIAAHRRLPRRHARRRFGSDRRDRHRRRRRLRRADGALRWQFQPVAPGTLETTSGDLTVDARTDDVGAAASPLDVAASGDLHLIADAASGATYTDIFVNIHNSVAHGGGYLPHDRTWTHDVRIETAGDDPSGGAIVIPASFAGDYDLAIGCGRLHGRRRGHAPGGIARRRGRRLDRDRRHRAVGNDGRRHDAEHHGRVHRR